MFWIFTQNKKEEKQVWWMALWTENPSLAYSNVSTNPVSEKFKSFEFEIAKHGSGKKLREGCVF